MCVARRESINQKSRVGKGHRVQYAKDRKRERETERAFLRFADALKRNRSYVFSPIPPSLPPSHPCGQRAYTYNFDRFDQTHSVFEIVHCEHEIIPNNFTNAKLRSSRLFTGTKSRSQHSSTINPEKQHPSSMRVFIVSALIRSPLKWLFTSL